MAKTATATKNKPGASRAVATKSTGGAVVDSDLAAMMQEDAGKGVSTSMEDNVVPLIYILQSQSPQVLKKKEEYVEGAEAGMAWFRGTRRVIDAENEGLKVQPCYFSKCWIEWMPDRGGFVERHAKRPDDAVLKTDPKNTKKKHWERPNGNQVVETREHVVLVHGVFDQPTPFVIPMSGSQHSASRNWMGLMNRNTLPNGQAAPSYACLYVMRTIFRTNDSGDWYMWDIENVSDEGPTFVDKDAYVLGRKIFHDFDHGVLRAGEADANNDETSTGESEI